MPLCLDKKYFENLFFSQFIKNSKTAVSKSKTSKIKILTKEIIFMTISEETKIFAGMPVERYNQEDGIKDPENKAYKVSLDFDQEDEGLKSIDLLKSFLEDPNAPKVKALTIGNWEEAFDESCDALIELLVEKSSVLKSLKALFIGDMTYEECEISWITQGSYEPIAKAFPELEELQVRGSNELSLANISHNKLKKLVVESGGLPSEVIDQILKSSLPEIEHLELWLGTDNYGFDGDWSTIEPILETSKFPKLKYLGLRDSELTDDIAKNIANHPILDQIEVLDLSLGILSDEGAKALLESDKVKSLKKLDLHFHYLSEEMMKKISDLPIETDVSDQQDMDDEYRYIAVSE